MMEIDNTRAATVKQSAHPIGAVMSLAALPTALLIPPVNLVPLTLAGLVLARRRPRLGGALAWIGMLGLLVFSLPLTANFLLEGLSAGQAMPSGAVPGAGPPPQAIVILSAEDRIGRPGGIVVGADAGLLTLERLRAGAVLARRTGLPVLVTGGRADPSQTALGPMMAQVLTADFAITPRWVEDRSLDTWQNAEYSARLLHAAGVSRVYLVSNAWHLPRARVAFRHFGIEAVPAPARLRAQLGISFDDFVPEARAWVRSYWAMHEWIGWGYYLLRDQMK